VIVAAGDKELPLSYLFVDGDDDEDDNDADAGSDAAALIYKLHTSDTIEYVSIQIISDALGIM